MAARSARPPAPAAPRRAAAAPKVPAHPLVGLPAPAFVLPDHAGMTASSAALKGSPYVLYFYPKDDTPGCTQEACDFRDRLGALTQARVKLLGVSPDSSASHARFRAKHGLPFALLADTQQTLAKSYGVWAPKTMYGRTYMGIVRSTFLVDGQGVVRQAWSPVKVPGHAEAVLEAVRAL